MVHWGNLILIWASYVSIYEPRQASSGTLFIPHVQCDSIFFCCAEQSKLLRDARKLINLKSHGYLIGIFLFGKMEERSRQINVLRT